MFLISRLRDISTIIRGFSEKSVDKYLSAVFHEIRGKKDFEKKTTNKQIRE